MENKRFLTRGKMLVALLVFLFAAATIGVLSTQFVVQAYANQSDDSVAYFEGAVEHSSSSRVRTIEDDELTIDDIRSILSSGGQIYQNIRVQSDTEGTRTFQVPIPEHEINYLLNYQDAIQPMNTNEFPYTRIRHSGRSHADSIVIVLMGDGFTAAQYAPVGTQGQVLWHANRAINAMIATPPFDAFAHLFTVYVVHVATPAGQAGFLGTVDANRNYLSASLTTAQANTIRTQATRPTGLTANNITMIQV